MKKVRYRLCKNIVRSQLAQSALQFWGLAFHSHCSCCCQQESQLVPEAVACRGLVMPGATAWLDTPLPNSSIEQWRKPMVVILPNIRCLWRHDMTSNSRLQTNVLVKFVDTTCILRDVGAAVGQRSSKMLRTMETYKKQKKSLPITFVSVHQPCWPQK